MRDRYVTPVTEMGDVGVLRTPVNHLHRLRDVRSHPVNKTPTVRPVHHLLTDPVLRLVHDRSVLFTPERKGSSRWEEVR